MWRLMHSLLPLLVAMLVAMSTTLTLVRSDARVVQQQPSGLMLTVYNNTATSGSGDNTSVISVPTTPGPLTNGDAPFSAKVVGTLSLNVASNSGYVLNSLCDFGAATLGYLHVDDHLICSTGVNTPLGSTSYLDQQIDVLSKTNLTFRMILMYNDSTPAIGQRFNISFELMNSAPEAQRLSLPTPSYTFTPFVSAAEESRDRMQSTLASGWGLWHQMSFVRHVLLPEGQVVELHLCDLDTKICTDKVLSGEHSNSFRLAEHAVDRSYGRMFLSLNSCNVSIEFGGGDGLLVLAMPVTLGVDQTGCEHFAMVATGSEAWYRRSHTQVTDGKLVFDSVGLRTTTLYNAAAAESSNFSLPAEIDALPHVVGYLDKTGFGLSSGNPMSVQEIASAMSSLRRQELRKYEQYGELAETKKAVQAAVMWTSIYNPIERGPIANIIRGNPFNLDSKFVNADWEYVMFDWDNTFASYMLSLDSCELGLSSLIQLVKSRTRHGYVSNWATPEHKRSWSQPPIAGKVLLEIANKYGNDSSHQHIVDQTMSLLFDDLKDWNTWFENNRALAPLNITCLGGSDDPRADGNPKPMQVARWESGMDNSPMFDDWNGDFANNKMQLYAVGMASLHTMDSDALSHIASLLDRESDSVELGSRANSMRELISEHLWDNESGIFVNRFPNGSFHRRVSPTSFYPLIVRAASATQAASMSSAWLMNSSRFCISPLGDFEGNSDDCYWGLPSISADDPAFLPLGYWRGYVWGPMAQLTYWGLQQYDNVSSARHARQSLVKQMNAMMLNKWQNNGYICENYSPHKVSTGCTGQPFYHWGALTGFISLLEAGWY